MRTMMSWTEITARYNKFILDAAVMIQYSGYGFVHNSSNRRSVQTDCLFVDKESRRLTGGYQDGG